MIIIIITRNFVEGAIKNNYPNLIKNIYSKNYDFHTQIIKGDEKTKFRLNIFDDNKVIHTINGVIDLVDIDERKNNISSYYNFLKLTSEIPEELSHDQNIECFLCEGTGKIDPDFAFIDDFQKILKDNSKEELIQMIKTLRRKNMNLMIELKNKEDELQDFKINNR